MKKKLAAKEKANQDEEAKLTSAFESADKMYAEALDAYDLDMRQGNTDLDEQKKVYEEKSHELHQLQEEWHHR